MHQFSKLFEISKEIVKIGESKTLTRRTLLMVIVVAVVILVFSILSANHSPFAGFEELSEDSTSTKWDKFRFDRDRSQLLRPNLFSSHQPFDKDVYDIMNMSQITFDPAYKNPCWNGSLSNGPIPDGQFHCVPYFYLIGVKKSGTSDLFSRISRHPEFVAPGFKESQWWSRLRWGKEKRFKGVTKSCKDKRSVNCYITIFDKAASKILRFQHHAARQQKYMCSLITADFTPSHLHIHKNWQLLPGNDGLLEPKYTNFHHINHVSPDVKIIILFRDPVTRLFSDFWHTMGLRDSIGPRTPEAFHIHVIKLTQTYIDCFKRSPMRRCIYNETIINNLIRDRVYLAESFNAGFYAFYMTELRNVFGSDRIHSVLTSEYHDDMENTMNGIFHFLDMKELPPAEMTRLLNQPMRHTAAKKGRHSEMLNTTRDLLYSFYKPFNREMASLMKDDRYLFPNTPV